ncbi:MAG: YedE-related selenium metabolism membrane protein [Acidobacteriota bacterium]|nr:MAG: YedE-related selenium metabolism membrane protein [Acidobacteriota bacterium]
MSKEKAPILIAGAAVGILAVILVLLGNPPNMGFCIACFERDIAGAIGLHRPWEAAWIRPEIPGILLGAFLTALFAREFRPRGGSSPMARFLVAMLVMIGALAFLGCPLRMILRLGGGDLNALVALAGFVCGVFVGVVLLKAGFNFGRAQRQRDVNGWIMPGIMAGLLMMAVFPPVFKTGGPIFVGAKGHPGCGDDPLVSEGLGIAISLSAGLLVGILAQRSRLCLVGGITDLMLVRSWHRVSGFIAILVLCFAGCLILHEAGVEAFAYWRIGFEGQPASHTAHLWNFLGMALVGVGSALLGGCPFRQLVLAGNGNTDSGLTILGMLAGAAIVHNFGLAGAATTHGKAAVVLGLVLVLLIGLLHREKG